MKATSVTDTFYVVELPSAGVEVLTAKDCFVSTSPDDRTLQTFHVFGRLAFHVAKSIESDIAEAVTAARLEEREACAKLIDDNCIMQPGHGDDYLAPRPKGYELGLAYAKAIRERKP